MDSIKFQEVTKSTFDIASLPPLAPKQRLRRYTGRVEDLPYNALETIMEDKQRPPKNIRTKHLRSALVYYTSRLSQAYLDALSVKRVVEITPEADQDGMKAMNRLSVSINKMFAKSIDELDIVIDEIKMNPCDFRPRVNPKRPARRANMCACKDACPDKALLYAVMFRDAIALRNVEDMVRYAKIIKGYE